MSLILTNVNSVPKSLDVRWLIVLALITFQIKQSRFKSSLCLIENNVRLIFFLGSEMSGDKRHI